MKIEYRLPSKNVQYGYVSLEGTPEELEAVDYKLLGETYIHSVKLFWDGEVGAVEAAIEDERKQPERVFNLPKNEVAASNLAAHPMRKVENVSLPEADAEKLLTEELGAVKISEEVYDEPVNETPKPWAAPAAFDFDN